MGYYFKYNGINYALHFTSYISVDYTDYYIGSDDQAWYEAIPRATATLYGFDVVNTNYKYGNDARAIYAYERNVINKLEFSYQNSQYQDQEGSKLTKIITNYVFKALTTYTIEIYRYARQQEIKIWTKNGSVNANQSFINISGCPLLNNYLDNGDGAHYKIEITLTNNEQGSYKLIITNYFFSYFSSYNGMVCGFWYVQTGRGKVENVTETLTASPSITTYYFYPYTDGTNYWSLT